MAPENASGATPLEKRESINAHTRLHAVLVNAGAQAGTTNISLALIASLKVVETDRTVATFKAAAILHRLFAIAEREIEYYLPEEIDFYIPALQAVRTALTPLTWHAAMDHAKGGAWASNLTHIQHTGQRLKRLSPECTLFKSELESIIDAIEELRMLIETLSIGEASKHKLRERLRDVDTSVEEYRFWGVTRIEVTFEAAKGALALHTEKDAQGGLTASWQKIGLVIAGITAFLGNANTAYKNVHDTLLAIEPTVHSVEKKLEPKLEAVVKSHTSQ